MFTHSSRDFGVWREGHVSHKRYPRRSLTWFLLAMGFASFVMWLIVIVGLKIRGDFFLISSTPLLLHETMNESVLLPYRQQSVTLGVVKTSSKLEVVFDDGKHFYFPENKEEMTKYLVGRKQNLELFAFFSKQVPEFASRVQIWPSRDVSFPLLRELIFFLTVVGFDDFDIAVRKREKKVGF